MLLFEELKIGNKDGLLLTSFLLAWSFPKRLLLTVVLFVENREGVAVFVLIVLLKMLPSEELEIFLFVELSNKLAFVLGKSGSNLKENYFDLFESKY